MKLNHKSNYPIRLYWGENYAPKPPAAKRALGRAFKQALDTAHLYPGELLTETVEALAKIYGVTDNQIFIGAGIEGILKEIFPVFLSPGDSIITLSPTFSVYEHNANALGVSVVHIPVNFNTQIMAKEILAIVTQQTKLIVIASPNPQTGIYHIDIKEFTTILSSFSGLMIVDECYFQIGKKTVLPLLKKFDNLMVLRSASKNWGLAGVRFGFALGSPAAIQMLTSHTISLAPDPLPTVSYLSVLAILPYRSKIAHTFVSFRDKFGALLSRIQGLSVYPTDTTFLPVVLLNSKNITSFVSLMEKHNIFLKDTQSLGYLLVGVPPEKDWNYVLSCFQYELTLL